jgi:ATP-dependent Lhr-like helicase
MTRDRWASIPDLLSSLEDREIRLLVWGVVDGFLSQVDVEEVIDAQLDVDAGDPQIDTPSGADYLEYLLDKGLLLRLPESTPRYRTRFGETLRLVRNLRQLWPPKDSSSPGWWRHAPALVADYRLRVGPRHYPRRTISPDDVLTELSALTDWTALESSVLSRVIGENHLARFQLDATASILEAIRAPHISGRIITAGTGSGKTLAFYLPALLHIAATSGDLRSGPHTLALYPRNELLRDQAREALRVVTALGPLDGRSESRPARIGLLYGSTPTDRDLRGSKNTRGWERRGTGWASPYFPCLTDGCQGSLIWLDEDRSVGRERLVCTSCDFISAPGTLALTRESMGKHPPDILFCSTEMLSQQSTNSTLARLLGWKGPNGTRLVLLDEVHTYSGVSGAQVSLMLRRWRHANRQWGPDSPVFVGLSATLRDAGAFFTALTGAERKNVEVIAPSPSELVPTSREYGIILRGNPVSGTPLLSTTIQTSMLLGRVLDRTPGIYGSVVFAFTDDLDVINRLYDNLRDAEGADRRGRAAGEVLADLRSPSEPQAGPRYADGQSWDLPYRLQRLDRPLRIGRTSSQSTGVDTSADIITATSALEVGFNDPRVGVVIQHKAPRDLASFLQRRGRAGRRLEMRPLTVVVLSDYGRDRIAYQTYEKLLDPEIDARSLPIHNRFVVKIQATHSLMDWISKKTGGDARKVLSPPWDGRPHDRTQQVIALLESLLANPQAQLELTDHLGRALSLSVDEVTAAMWEEPRSLMSSVVPTALRRLEASWKPLPGESDPGAQDRTPLPEFMTATLFASLNTPDVRFALPSNFGDAPPPMPIGQALREAVPGRVSRRFGHAHASLRTWVPVPDSGTDLELMDVVVKGHGLGTWATASGQSYTVVRPLELRLVSPPRDVSDSSSAQPLWQSAFEYSEETLSYVDLPKPSIWTTFIDKCAFALHVNGGHLKVRRMAVGADGELTYGDGRRDPLHVRYVHDGVPAALGFELDVDAMILTGQMPERGSELLEDFSSSPQWRTLAFRRRVLEDHRLDDLVNVFQREWLCNIYLDAFIAQGLATDDLEQVPHLLSGGRWTENISGYISTVHPPEGSQDEESRLVKALETLSVNPTVLAVIEEHAGFLVAGALGFETGDLLDRVLVDTLANAVLTAVEESLVDANEGDLAVDVEWDLGSRGYRILVSETSIGGLGLLEVLQQEYLQDPRAFWQLVERACSPTEAEAVDEAMGKALAALVQSDAPFAMAVNRFRMAEGANEMDQALEQLRDVWTKSDGPPSHLLVSTFAVRFLRPGSSSVIDRLIARIAAEWVSQESRVGVEIDARTLVHHASKGDLGFDLAPLLADSAYSLLWQRGPQARLQRLSRWHPYRQDVVVERLILEGLINDGTKAIDVTQGDWLQEYIRTVEVEGRAILSVSYPDRLQLAEAVREATVTPVERSGLRVFARVTAIQILRGKLRASMSLAEELQ